MFLRLLAVWRTGFVWPSSRAMACSSDSLPPDRGFPLSGGSWALAVKLRPLVVGFLGVVHLGGGKASVKTEAVAVTVVS
jgi:hypothetical protein